MFRCWFLRNKLTGAAPPKRRGGPRHRPGCGAAATRKKAPAQIVYDRSNRTQIVPETETEQEQRGSRFNFNHAKDNLALRQRRQPSKIGTNRSPSIRPLLLALPLLVSIFKFGTIHKVHTLPHLHLKVTQNFVDSTRPLVPNKNQTSSHTRRSTCPLPLAAPAPVSRQSKAKHRSQPLPPPPLRPWKP